MYRPLRFQLSSLFYTNLFSLLILIKLIVSDIYLSSICKENGELWVPNFRNRPFLVQINKNNLNILDVLHPYTCDYARCIRIYLLKCSMF